MVNRRVGVKRDRVDGRRISHGKAEGSNIVTVIMRVLKTSERCVVGEME